MSKQYYTVMLLQNFPVEDSSAFIMKVLVVFSLVFSGFSCEQQNTTRLNLWADSLIEDIIKKLKSTDREFLPVPNFHKEIVEHKGKIPIKRGILAAEGVFGELTSLQRKSNVNVSGSGDTTTIYIPIVIKKAGVHFDTVLYWCGTTNTVDELEIKVPPYEQTDVYVTIQLKKVGNRCSTIVKRASVNKFKNLDVILSDFCVSEIADMSVWAVNYFNKQVISVIESILVELITEQTRTSDSICLLV